MRTARRRTPFVARAAVIGLIATAPLGAFASSASADPVDLDNPGFEQAFGPSPSVGFDPAVWDDSEAGDYLRSSNPTVLSFDGLKQFTVTGNGGGPRDELKTPQAARVASDEIYESFSADITFKLDDGVKLIAHQIHAGTGAGFSTQAKLYVQDSSPLGIFKGEGESNLTMDDFPLLEGVPSNGIFDVYVRVQIPGFISGDGEINEEIFALGTIRSGRTMSYEFINDHGVVTVNSTIGRRSGRKSVSFTYDMQDSAASYMKFGSYVQAQDAESGCNVTNDLDCEYPGWEPYGVATNTEEAEALWREYFADSNIDRARVTFRNVVHKGGPLQ